MLCIYTRSMEDGGGALELRKRKVVTLRFLFIADCVEFVERLNLRSEEKMRCVSI